MITSKYKALKRHPKAFKFNRHSSIDCKNSDLPDIKGNLNANYPKVLNLNEDSFISNEEDNSIAARINRKLKSKENTGRISSINTISENQKIYKNFETKFNSTTLNPESKRYLNYDSSPTEQNNKIKPKIVEDSIKSISVKHSNQILK